MSRFTSSMAAAFLAAFLGLSGRAQSVSATLTVGANAYAVAVNPVTNKIYVVNRNASGSVTVVDGATSAMTSIPVGGLPSALDINTVTNRVYVANFADGTVSVIDGSSGAVIATVATGRSPTQVVVNAKANTIYVLGEWLDGTETVIDGTTNAVVDQIFGGNDPTFIAVDPTTDMLYVNAQANNLYTMIVTPTLYSAKGLIPNVPVFNGFDTVSLVQSGENVFSMAADPVTDQVVEACVNENGIFVFNMDSQGLVKSYKHVESGGNYLLTAINPVTGVAYVTSGNFAATGVDAVDLTTYTDTPIASAGLPLAIALDQNANAVYVVNDSQPGNPGQVNAIDGATNLVTSVTVGNQPFALAVNPVTTKVYVLNSDATGTMSVIDGITANLAPKFSSQPRSQVISSGGTVAFNADTTALSGVTYQWTYNGVPIADGVGVSGSTTGTLVLTGVTPASSGSYAAVATSSLGHATSSSATLEVSASASPGRVINLSTRALIDNGRGVDGAQVLIAGFVIQGSSPKNVILRGVGPALSNFGISGATGAGGPVQHPALTLFDSASPANVITRDLGWQSPPAVPTGVWKGVTVPADATSADFGGAGAFSLPEGSADSAVKLSLPPGSYTQQVTTDDPGNGIVLAEVYDDDQGPSSSKLVNISSRAYIGSNVNAMIAGFVVSGSTSATVLIRASGPALAALGVGNTATNPNVLLFDSSGKLIASNSKWGGSAQISAAAARVGAFTWNDPASQDAAVLVTLPPGAYTAEVNPTVNPFGNALIEVYVLP